MDKKKEKNQQTKQWQTKRSWCSFSEAQRAAYISSNNMEYKMLASIWALFNMLSRTSRSCAVIILRKQILKFNLTRHKLMLWLVPPACRLKAGRPALAALSWIVNLQTVAPDIQLHRFKCHNTAFKPKVLNINMESFEVLTSTKSVNLWPHYKSQDEMSSWEHLMSEDGIDWRDLTLRGISFDRGNLGCCQQPHYRIWALHLHTRSIDRWMSWCDWLKISWF